MYTAFHPRFLFLGLIAMLSLQCEDKKAECEENICTTEFRTLSVKVVDSLNQPITIDKLEVIVGGQIIFQSTTADLNGQYSYADDSFMTLVGRNKTINPTVKIYKNNALVKTENYVVKTDCCHINKVSGSDVLVLL